MEGLRSISGDGRAARYDLPFAAGEISSDRTFNLFSFVPMFEDAEGALWFAAASSLFKLKDGVTTAFTAPDGMPESRVRAIVQDRAGAISLWLGTSGGLAVLSPDFSRLSSGGDSRLPADSVGILFRLIAITARAGLKASVVATETIRAQYDECHGLSLAQVQGAVEGAKTEIINNAAANTTTITNNDDSDKNTILNSLDTKTTTVTNAITNAQTSINNTTNASSTAVQTAITNSKNEIINNDNSNKTAIVNNDNSNAATLNTNLTNARNTIINNDNTNTTNIVNNDNTNKNTIIANDNTNTTNIVNERQRQHNGVK